MLPGLRVESSLPLTHLCLAPLLLLQTDTGTETSLKRLMKWLWWIHCRMGLVGNWVVCGAKPMMRVLFPLGTLSHKWNKKLLHFCMMKKTGPSLASVTHSNNLWVNAFPVIGYETWLPLVEIQFISAEKNWVSPWMDLLPHSQSGPSTGLVTF